MSKLISEAQKANPDAVVILFDLDLRDFGGPIFRFTPEVLNPDADIVEWRGQEYFPTPVQAEGFEMSGSGQFPRPKLIVSNVLGTLKAEMIAYNNLVGATVTRWRTYAKHLDGGADPDPDVHFPPDVFKIDRKAEETPAQITFELATIIDQQGIMLPRRQILRNTCTHVYRIWNSDTEQFDYTKATCPYAGTDYFDENGNSVSLPEQDAPSKLLDSCCKKRFPNQALPTRAFPGVGRFR